MGKDNLIGKIKVGIKNKYENIIDLINYTYYRLFKDNIVIIYSWTFQLAGYVKKRNFGDDINNVIVSFLSGKKVLNGIRMIEKYNVKTDVFLCVGSIVEKYCNKDTIIWGSGNMYEESEIQYDLPRKIYAVRGALTREKFLKRNIDCPSVYGDPALLLPCIYRPNVEKKYKLGIIPHIRDIDQPNVASLVAENLNVVLIRFDKYNSWKSVVELINQCEIIISSSLHGLIIADAYNIPNVWIKLSDSIHGGNFKYLDYFSGVGRKEIEPVDYRYRCIDYNEVINLASSYSPIYFDAKALMESCPFINDSIKSSILF